MAVETPMTRSGREALIVEALRTPMGKAHPERGWYRDTHPNEMLGAVYTALLEHTGLAAGAVEDIVIGCTAPFGEQSRNVARNAWLQAGYPAEVPAPCSTAAAARPRPRWRWRPRLSHRGRTTSSSPAAWSTWATCR